MKKVKSLGSGDGDLQAAPPAQDVMEVHVTLEFFLIIDDG